MRSLSTLLTLSLAGILGGGILGVGVSVAGIAQPYAPMPRPGLPAISGIGALRSEFLMLSGGDTIIFLSGSAGLSAQSKARLVAEAAWLRRHPEVTVRIEGYGDSQDTRDHALAMGARRAIELRDYLVLMGVPQEQIGVMSWGRERGGAGRAVTVLVSALSSGPTLGPGER